MTISIVIPVYNEQATIAECLDSLNKQNIHGLNVVVVDDGSTDKTVELIDSEKERLDNLKISLLKQDHKGPGAARNIGVSKTNGDILVFVDADMEFSHDFIEKLTKPIVDGQSIGTFSKQEYLLNKESALARCWNLNLGRRAEKMHPDSYPDTQPVFRAIARSEFDKAGGFDLNTGYTDDWSLSRKLGKLATATNAVYYHKNPESYQEIWKQARWYGKNEFLTRSLVRKLFNLLRFFPLFAPIKGIYHANKFSEPLFIYFQLVFDSAVFVSILKSFFNEAKSK